jgi:FixJ family two-component response regulator
MGDTDQKTCRPQHARGQTSSLIATIDHDESMQGSLRDLIESAGLVTRCFGSAEEFLESDLHRRASCVIAAINMPKMSGLELQARLKDEELDIPIIFITAGGDARMRIQAMREGAVEFLTKPFDRQFLLETLRAALDMQNRVSKQSRRRKRSW